MRRGEGGPSLSPPSYAAEAAATNVALIKLLLCATFSHICHGNTKLNFDSFPFSNSLDFAYEVAVLLERFSRRRIKLRFVYEFF